MPGSRNTPPRNNGTDNGGKPPSVKKAHKESKKPKRKRGDSDQGQSPARKLKLG